MAPHRVLHVRGPPEHPDRRQGPAALLDLRAVRGLQERQGPVTQLGRVGARTALATLVACAGRAVLASVLAAPIVVPGKEGRGCAAVAALCDRERADELRRVASPHESPDGGGPADDPDAELTAYPMMPVWQAAGEDGGVRYSADCYCPLRPPSMLLA